MAIAMQYYRIFMLVIGFTMLLAVGQVWAMVEPQPEPPSAVIKKDLVQADTAMVTAAHPLAAEEGMRILKEGGNAIDAAIAVQMVLNVVEPQSSGIGGGGFLMYYDAGHNQLISLDGRETAPASASPALFLKEDGTSQDFLQAVKGGKSVGVPGLLAMLERAHKNYGALPWPTLFTRATQLAEEGFPMSPRLYDVVKDTPHLREFKGMADILLDEQGRVKPVGAIIRQPELAATLRSIAKGGAQAFYKGPIAKAIVEAVEKSPVNPGALAMADLANYRMQFRKPVCGLFYQFQVCGMGPPSSGGIAVLQSLIMLEQVDIAALSPFSAPAIHAFIEASKRSFADRNRYLADSDFVEVPVVALLDKGYLAKRAKEIFPDKAGGLAEAGVLGTQPAGSAASQEYPSTTHMSIVDKDGNAVAMTTSIEQAFGSGIMVKGFMLNNQLTDFSFVPAEKEGEKIANRVGPGKRPRSSMAPVVVFDRQGKLVLVLGSPGGSAIIPYVVQVLVSVLSWQMDIQQAIAYPHIVNRNTEVTEVEADDRLEGALRKLERMGHHFRFERLTSGVHAIFIKDGILYGGADPRREGVAIGTSSLPLKLK